ncbi:hypothetical protein [Fictibacillus terranigra]|uniref:Uncharacterized protein n=1 Tax=Fictibacillus terranigra TaxID=3058424 RepID=A0ABT8ECL2_9BACL|nr:hypothetical protein [Fictibacillus sp. CENA-BCM004]MDN4075648.1 hypothetical protein [Fictibacillus sp. CENA-BCM004]
MEDYNDQQETEGRNWGHMHNLCKKHLYFHVIVTMNDGKKTEGIITNVDGQNLHMMVPQDIQQQQAGQGSQQGMQAMQGQQGTLGREDSEEERIWFGRPWFGRRFFPGIFPLASVAALSLYPYYYPYPYYPYPPYPYYPYPPYPYYPYPYPYY